MQVAAVLLLQRHYRRGDVALDQGRVLPVERFGERRSELIGRRLVLVALLVVAGGALVGATR
jgi:hypothetical protein